MVGHSGMVEPTIKAIEAVDENLGRVVDALIAKGVNSPLVNKGATDRRRIKVEKLRVAAELFFIASTYKTIENRKSQGNPQNKFKRAIDFPWNWLRYLSRERE